MILQCNELHLFPDYFSCWRCFSTFTFWTVHAKRNPPTWNTVMRAWGKLSKVLRGLGWLGKLNFPPNTCIPSREKITMKRKRSSSKQAMERTEFKREATRLLRDVQYLGPTNQLFHQLSLSKNLALALCQD